MSVRFYLSVDMEIEALRQFCDTQSLFLKDLHSELLSQSLNSQSAPLSLPPVPAAHLHPECPCGFMVAVMVAHFSGEPLKAA